MKPSLRRVALYGVLLVSLAAARWFGSDTAFDADPGASMPSRTPRAMPAHTAPLDHVSSQANGKPALALYGRSREVVARDDKNPFEVKTWVVAPLNAAVANQVAPSPALPAPQPSAPALPFLFAGKLEIAPGKWLVYLTKGEQFIAVEIGETFDGVYRFDGIENDNIIIIYLPLDTKQLLPTGSAS
ncbi:hypothetical protein LXA47_08360 [Massilia sp. P8910]|uniref:hypothetical protein n=1 Tax=Massilia antarctica TaxID=2765360 RepID=UPI001E4CA04E|nr:hypothetical protein [Massilia antarctica]MCE3603618.1 hypothetical protein [Massilia antarctica]